LVKVRLSENILVGRKFPVLVNRDVGVGDGAGVTISVVKDGVFENVPDAVNPAVDTATKKGQPSTVALPVLDTAKRNATPP
jgi:hypothetical protein